METADSIYRRKSVRKYSDKELTENELKAIGNIIDNVEKLDDKISFKAYIVNGKKIHNSLFGFFGNYGKVIAPHYIIAASEEKGQFKENTGYILEQAVLELTRMGIATCWIGGPVNKSQLKDIVNIPEGMNIIILIAFGYPAAGIELLRKDISEFKRKKLSDIAFGDINEKYLKLIEAARLAPSAINLQPCRYFVEEGKIHVYIDPGNIISQKTSGHLKQIDAGIALSHMMIMAMHNSIDIRFKKTSAQVKKGMDYVMTAEILD